MGSETTAIETIRDQTLTQIEQMTLDPKPSYSVDGQRVEWQAYLESLQQTVDWCERKLSDAEPFETRSEGRS